MVRGTSDINGSSRRGVGGDVRNQECFLMGVVAKQEACDISVLATDLFTLKTCPKFALDCYVFPLIVESDCLEDALLMEF